MEEQLKLLEGTPVPPREWVTDTPPEQFPAEILVQLSRHKYIRASFLTHERRFSQKAGQFAEVVIFHRDTPQLNFREALYQLATRGDVSAQNEKSAPSKNDARDPRRKQW
jgi:hypothetical protein